LCQAVGPVIVRPLAEALAVEENNKAIRRLRELLLGFGAAGRQSVEQLKTSSNPAVRRTAIDLLRVFGGSEALPELASMLSDSDPQVQRESIRAIVQIGTADAHGVLQRALLAGGDAREALLKELIDLRDERAIPVLCYALDHIRPRGKLVQVHVDIIDALGGLHAHADSLRTLRRVLYAGEWWAPVRTAALRRAASDALRRIGTREAAAILQEAAAKGSRGVRNAARANAAAATRRERT
jgi:HEAT repeat protein